MATERLRALAYQSQPYWHRLPLWLRSFIVTVATLIATASGVWLFVWVVTTAVDFATGLSDAGVAIMTVVFVFAYLWGLIHLTMKRIHSGRR